VSLSRCGEFPRCLSLTRRRGRIDVADVQRSEIQAILDAVEGLRARR